MQENSAVERKRVKAAKYLPSTMPVSEMGAVSSICSVRIFRSSAKRRIVSSGRMIAATNIIMLK